MPLAHDLGTCMLFVHLPDTYPWRMPLAHTLACLLHAHLPSTWSWYMPLEHAAGTCPWNMPLEHAPVTCPGTCPWNIHLEHALKCPSPKYMPLVHDLGTWSWYKILVHALEHVPGAWTEFWSKDSLLQNFSIMAIKSFYYKVRWKIISVCFLMERDPLEVWRSVSHFLSVFCSDQVSIT